MRGCIYLGFLGGRVSWLLDVLLGVDGWMDGLGGSGISVVVVVVITYHRR